MLSWTVLRARRWQLPAGGQWTRHIAQKKTRDEDQHVSILDQEFLGLHDEMEHHGHTDSAGALEADGEDELPEPDLTPEDVRPPFTDAFTIPDGAVRTHRVRRHGNTLLPLSPVIDPVFVAARNRWKMKKAQPPKSDQTTPFQKKLLANAYGMSLYSHSSKLAPLEIILILPQHTPSQHPSAPQT